jgi:excisionase family DNA binding protein
MKQSLESIRPAYLPEEAAKILGVSRSWVIQKAADKEHGGIPGAYRTQGESGHWRFDPDAFDRYVRDLRAGKVPRETKRKTRGKSGPRKPRNVEMNEWLEGFRKAG